MSTVRVVEPDNLAGWENDTGFAIAEECFQYEECGLYRPFVERGMAVFEADYELPPARFCADAAAIGFSAIRKAYDLFAQPWEPCVPLARRGKANLGQSGTRKAQKETRWDRPAPRATRGAPCARRAYSVAAGSALTSESVSLRIRAI